MKIKKEKSRISIKKFNIKRLPNNEIKTNINLFLNRVYSNRNKNNHISSNIHFKKKFYDAKFKNEINLKEKFASLTDDEYKVVNKIKNVNMKNIQLNSKDNLTLKNKSSDDLPKKLKEKNNFSIFIKRNINEMNNPINRKFFFTYNDSSDNEFNNSKEETKIILNKKIFKRIFINDNNFFISNSGKKSRSYSFNSSTFSTDILKNQISKIVKDILKKHKNGIKFK